MANFSADEYFLDIGYTVLTVCFRNLWSIGHFNEYPTMNYFENHRHAQSMMIYMILTDNL